MTILGQRAQTKLRRKSKGVVLMNSSHNYAVSFRQALDSLADVESQWLEMLRQGILPRYEVQAAIRDLYMAREELLDDFFLEK